MSCSKKLAHVRKMREGGFMGHGFEALNQYVPEETNVTDINTINPNATKLPDSMDSQSLNIPNTFGFQNVNKQENNFILGGGAFKGPFSVEGSALKSLDPENEFKGEISGKAGINIGDFKFQGGAGVSNFGTTPTVKASWRPSPNLNISAEGKFRDGKISPMFNARYTKTFEDGGYIPKYAIGGTIPPQEQPYIRDFNFTQRDIDYLNKNKEFCPNGQCLESSYKAYDKLIGNQYPEDMFPTSNKLKESMGIQSSNQELYDLGSDKYRELLNNTNYMNPEKGDFTVDSWDIHGKMIEAGGTNLFTDPELSGSFANMTPEERKALYASIPVGSIIGMGGLKPGSTGDMGINAEQGLINNRHSGQVMGFTEDGIPIMWDSRSYTSIEDPTYSNLPITNITYPKGFDKYTKQGLVDMDMFDTTPEELGFDYSKLSQQADSTELDRFYGGLKDRKSRLMNDLNIDNEEYDNMSKLLMAISMQETGGGTNPEHNIQSSLGTTFGDTQGLTQLNINNILDDPKLAKIAKKYGITEEADLYDARKSAIASMIYGYRNKLSADKNYKKGKEKGVRTFSPNSRSQVYDGSTFNTEEGQSVDVTNMLGINRSIEDINKDFNSIARGKYVAKEKDGKIVIDKATAGNSANLTPEEQFIYNWQSPNTLATGDAQGDSNYAKQVMNFYRMLEPKKQLAQK